MPGTMGRRADEERDPDGAGEGLPPEVTDTGEFVRQAALDVQVDGEAAESESEQDEPDGDEPDGDEDDETPADEPSDRRESEPAARPRPARRAQRPLGQRVAFWGAAAAVIIGGFYLGRSLRSAPRDGGTVVPATTRASARQSASSRPGAGGGSAPAASASAASLAERLLRGPCREQSQCPDGGVAWCDVRGQRLACCAPGLVASGEGDSCACPPGGSDKPAAARAQCPAAPRATGAERSAALTEAMQLAAPDLEACRVQARKRSIELPPSPTLLIELSPDGDVFDARLDRAEVDDPALQPCVLQAVRHLSFPPPYHGSEQVRVKLAPLSAP